MPDENLTFRALTHDEIAADIHRMFEDIIGEKVTEEQFAWKYYEYAKDCQKDVWGAFVGDELAGATATLTRPFFRKGQPVLTFQLYDSIIERKHQRKGIYRKMVNYALGRMRELDSLYMFAFPNNKSGGALMGLPGAFDSYTSKIMVLPLGAKYLSKRVFKRTIPVITPVGSLFVKLFNLLRGVYGKSQLTMDVVDRFDEYTSELSRRNSMHYWFFPDRSPDFLNWKGIDVPASFKQDIHSFWFKRNGERAGYCILCNDPKNSRLKILDLVCEPEKGLLIECIKSVRTYARQNNYDLIQMIVAGRPYLNALKSCGFLNAGQVRTNLIPLTDDGIKGADQDTDAYYQSPIDRDNFSYS